MGTLNCTKGSFQPLKHSLTEISLVSPVPKLVTTIIIID